MARKFQTAKRLTGLHPLAYMGVEPSAPPLVVLNDRSPTPNDYYNFNIGTIWLVQDPIEIWMLLLLDAGVATWVQLDGGGGAAPDFPTDSGTAVVAGGELNIFGGDLINTSAVGNTVTVALDEGLDGQVIIGATGGSPAWNYLISSDGTIDIDVGPNSIDLTAAGGEGIDTVPTDIGTATPAAGILNIFGGSVRVLTQGSGNTVTVDVNDTIADQYDTDSGSAIPVGNVLNVFGGNAIATSGSGNTITIETNEIYQADIGTAQPAANTINIVGGTGITTSASGSTITIDATGGGGGAGGVVITKFTANGTWTKNAQSQMVTIYGWSGAGGGGGGIIGGNSTTLGGGGGGANTMFYTVPSQLFSASETVTIGSGGSGGAGSSTTTGNNGVNGGETGVGSVIIPGGRGGNGGQSFSGATQINQGFVYSNATTLPTATFTAGTSINSALPAFPAGYGLASGASAGNGGSGGIISFTTSWGGRAGNVGVGISAFNLASILAGGSAGALNSNGGNGLDWTGIGTGGAFGGGTGGGGGGCNSPATIGTPGNGGNGGIPGGGGGGGGNFWFGTTPTPGTGGSGGNGARGELWIIEYLGGTGGMNSEAFSAYLPTSINYLLSDTGIKSLGSDGVLVEEFDLGNNFYVGDGAGAPATFTAPATGEYLLQMTVTLNPSGPYVFGIPIRIATTQQTYQSKGEGNVVTGANNSSRSNSFSIVTYMEAGDVATFQYTLSASSDPKSIAGSAVAPLVTFVSGYRVA